MARAIIRKLHVAFWPKRLDTPGLDGLKDRNAITCCDSDQVGPVNNKYLNRDARETLMAAVHSVVHSCSAFDKRCSKVYRNRISITIDFSQPWV